MEALAVSAGYGGDPVLDDVSVGLRKGEILAVVGPNGAGKSTLVRVLAGTLTATSGEVRLAGAALPSLARREIARRVAVVEQESTVAFGFTVREVVAMGRAPRQSGWMVASAEDEAAVERALERCELQKLGARQVNELSGGERRRVVIARALAQDPEVLLLDEAAAHLDIQHAEDFYSTAAAESERGVACMAVMHDLTAAARWSDRVLLLAEGRVVALGPSDQVLTEAQLSATFGVALRVGATPDGEPFVVPRRAGV